MSGELNWKGGEEELAREGHLPPSGGGRGDLGSLPGEERREGGCRLGGWGAI